MTTKDLHTFQQRVIADFIVSVLLSNSLWGILIYSGLVAADKTLVAIPLLALLTFFANLYRKVPIQVANMCAVFLGYLSAILQPAYMILIK